MPDHLTQTTLMLSAEHCTSVGTGTENPTPTAIVLSSAHPSAETPMDFNFQILNMEKACHHYGDRDHDQAKPLPIVSILYNKVDKKVMTHGHERLDE